MNHSFRKSTQHNPVHGLRWAGVLVLAALVLAACQSTTSIPAVTEIVIDETIEGASEVDALPSVAVSDQAIEGGSITISQVTSDGPGWLVVHAQTDGKPGPILGYSQVKDGENLSIAIEIDTANATEILYAMLHTDAGEIGTFKFPDGPDAPVKVDGEVVTPSFLVTAGLVEITPAVVVEDQSIEGGVVTVTEVTNKGPGWLVVHAQAEGKPGPILGYTQVTDGENADVKVDIDLENATETLYAMLHTDAGETGAFEFPDGPDVPVQVDGQVLTPPFLVTGGLMPDPVVTLGGNEDLGEFLTTPNGMTLYTFANDETGVSNCYDQCAVNWPPLLLEEGQELLAGEGLMGELASVERTDGGMQVIYNGLPLYFWVQDSEPGHASGHGVNEVWAVARGENPSVQLVSNEELGAFLVGSNGMSLYIFTNDQPGVSNCYDQCSINWPPLLLAEGQMLTGGAGVTGELTTIERSDGGLQVTYNGRPLYFWVQDVNPGDTSGHFVNDVWFVAMPKDQVIQNPASASGSSSGSSGGSSGGSSY